MKLRGDRGKGAMTEWQWQVCRHGKIVGTQYCAECADQITEIAYLVNRVRPLLELLAGMLDDYKGSDCDLGRAQREVSELLKEVRG